METANLLEVKNQEKDKRSFKPIQGKEKLRKKIIK